MVFNIVSGKGGTGKTLFCTVLAEMLGNNGSKVVVIDMDFAVRGLTALLYYYKGETYNIVPDGSICTYDYFEGISYPKQVRNALRHRKVESSASINYPKQERSVSYLNELNQNLGIAKYRSFDVIPAVSKINKIIKLYPELNELEYCNKVKSLISFLIEDLKYNHIIFDCRAGYDLLNAALHNISDITICVQEEDEISNITTSNLIRQFEIDSRKPIYNLINKARFSDESYDSNTFILKRDVTYLGSIPFDLDVMKDFGKSYFWNKIVYTLYYQSVANIWNRLAIRLNLNERVDYQRISPFGYNEFERRLGMFSFKDRLLLVFGFTISLLGFSLSFLGIGGLKRFIIENSEQTISFLLGISGLMLSIYTILKAKSKK